MDIVAGSRDRIGFDRTGARKSRDRFQCQIRIDRGRSESEQKRIVHDFPHLAGLNDQPGFRTEFRIDQSPVDRGAGKQTRDRRHARLEGSVGKDQDSFAILRRLYRFFRQVAQSVPQSGFPARSFESAIENMGMESVDPEILQMLQLVIGQDRTAQFDETGMFRSLFQNVAPVADVGHETHHKLFPDRIDRRVRHLCEKLFEIGEEKLRFFGENCQRGIIAHGADRFLALFRHRLQNDVDIFAGASEELLAADQILFRFRWRDVGEKTVDGKAVLLHPAAIRLASRKTVLDLGIEDQAMMFEIEKKDLAGFQASLALHFFRRNIQNSGLARQNKESVFTFCVTCRAQTVAVEDRAGVDAVCESDSRGTIPWFHQSGVIFEESPDIAAHVIFCPPSLRDEHQHGVFDGASGCDQQFQHIIETCRIALTRFDQRKDFFQIVAQDRRSKEFFPCLERIQIAAQGIDLAVVGETAEWVRQLPCGKCVRAVPLMDDRKARPEKFIGKIGIELFDLSREQKTFIYDRARGHAADVKIKMQFFDETAHHEKFAFEFSAVTKTAAVDEKLADRGAVLPCFAPDRIRIDRDLSPSENGGSF